MARGSLAGLPSVVREAIDPGAGWQEVPWAWDRGTATLLARAGFPAIATTSAAPVRMANDHRTWYLSAPLALTQAWSTCRTAIRRLIASSNS